MLRKYFVFAVCLVIVSFCCLTGRLPKNVKDFEGVELNNTLQFGGKERDYQIYLPKGYNSSKKYPLIFGLHGGGGRAEQFNKMSASNYFADQYQVVMVYPQGLKKHWNDGRSIRDTSVDDVGFLDKVFLEVVRKFSIDQTRVYSMGISNGGLMSYRLACERSTRFIAIASVVATLGENISKKCKPSLPISVYMILGTDDPLVPYKGGQITGPFGGRKLGNVLSARQSFLFWLKKNHCSSTLKKIFIDNIAEDETSIKREISSDCKGFSEVRMDTIENGGHTWPQGWQYFGEWIIGKTTQEINGTEEIFRFFLKFHR